MTLLEELSFIKEVDIDLCEFNKLGEAQKIRKDGKVLYRRGKTQQTRIKDKFRISGTNVLEFYSPIEWIALLTLELNERRKLKFVQVYDPTCSHDFTIIIGTSVEK